MNERIRDIYLKHKEVIMYLVMGVATTIVNWATYAVMVKILGFLPDNLTVFWSNVVAWIFGVTFAYITNKIFVFESESWKINDVIKEASLFVSARLITGLIEIVGVPFLVETCGFDMKIFGITGMAAKVSVSVIVIILNYVFSKLLVFKKDEETEE